VLIPAVVSCAAAGFVAVYAAFMRPSLAEKEFVAQAAAIRRDLSRGVDGGDLPREDLMVSSLLAFLGWVVVDPRGATALLRRSLGGDVTARHLSASRRLGRSSLSHPDLESLDGYWRRLGDAAIRFAVDGSPWWPAKRFWTPRTLDAPLAVLPLLEIPGGYRGEGASAR
jgi:hypothetical protein